MTTAILGGTFNPVHNGHLRIAVELAELLGVDQLRMIPCATPPHRDAPDVSAKQRMAMLELAVAGQTLLAADDIEIRRSEKPSYTIDTVLDLRSQLGDSEPLYLCLGMDSLCTLDSWHRWQELLDHCHLVVTARPGAKPPATGEIAELLKERACDAIQELQSAPAGKIYLFDCILLPISSTKIRDLVAGKKSIDFLTPQPVVSYINQHNLYR